MPNSPRYLLDRELVIYLMDFAPVYGEIIGANYIIDSPNIDYEYWIILLMLFLYKHMQKSHKQGSRALPTLASTTEVAGTEARLFHVIFAGYRDTL